MAYCDTVTDALSVQATKHNIKGGNENLQSMQLIAKSFGGITGCILAAIFQQSHLIDQPEICFGIYVGLQVVLFLSAFLMNQKIDPPKEDIDGNSSFFLNSFRKQGSEENYSAQELSVES